MSEKDLIRVVADSRYSGVYKNRHLGYEVAFINDNVGMLLSDTKDLKCASDLKSRIKGAIYTWIRCDVGDVWER